MRPFFKLKVITVLIYEYQCQHCGFEFEALQKISDTPLLECKQCQHKSLKKKISAAGFRLKGNGWYETDFKTKGQKNLVKPAVESKTE